MKKTALNQAIEQAIGRDLMKEGWDILENTTTNYTKQDVAEKLRDIFNGASNDPWVKNEMEQQLFLSLAGSLITKGKNLKIIGDDGQVDALAIRSWIVNVSKGVYIRYEFANVDTMKSKEEEQRKHIEDSQKKLTAVTDFNKKVSDVMYANDFETVGEALEFMGI